ncbi:DNA-binding transcriptional regulator, LysR family [Andreprevotia lacus DSM 23236]|jgi:DNA-binding transcriptional LysR family regulator|uniref:DNA-binding transcriptional regulator, LysR family n=1 Tax=Andreprevotia lacus DSM 23236 TaxID=1121001 RepID=A0A1W1X300_9NEIS|nr:LysR family transcriptional regulator [Andreprevotia lacus]SMC18349.1 DNA-binding transcriptional regulator, LysR family [Andreprevotia lacus DSM 23236]
MKTTLDELQALVAVIDCGSITAAARQLQQTVSGVSRALARLEEKLGASLLLRTTRRLELTEEGRLFLQQARRILAAVDEAEEQLTLRRARPAGRLRVNAASPYMLHVLVPMVAGFRAAYPDIALELHSSDHVIDLLEQRTDVAIRIGPLSDSTLHARPLGGHRLRVLASPAYLARHGMPHSVEALAQHSLLGFTLPESLNQWPLRHAGGERYAIAPSLQASSGDALLALALAGEGIVCLADFMTANARAGGLLHEVLADYRVDVRQPVHAVYYRNTALAARIACFLDYLAAHLAGWQRDN